MIKALAVLGFVAMLATASDAFAFGGGKKGSGGTFAGGSTISTASVHGGGGGGGGVTAPEPFAGLAVGLGLLGARLLRRR